MKKLVIQFLDKGAMVLFVLIIIGGFLSGYSAGGLATAIVGAIVSFVFAVPFFGFVFLMLKMNENIKALRELTESKRSLDGA